MQEVIKRMGLGADEDQSLSTNIDILAVNEIAMAVVTITSSWEYESTEINEKIYKRWAVWDG